MSEERLACLFCKKTFKNEANRITHHNKFHSILNVNNENDERRHNKQKWYRKPI